MAMKIQDPNRVWFTSDLHFGHRMAVAERGFASVNFEQYTNIRDEAGLTAREIVSDEEVEAMNDGIINVINAHVPIEDTLFVLGDFSMHAKQPAITAWLDRIACDEIHLIQGNHDDWKSIKDAGFASISTRKEISHKINGKRDRLIVDHFPIVSWVDCHKGTVHAHGHCHGSGDNGDLKRFDLGIDSFEVQDILGFDRPTAVPFTFTANGKLASPVTFAEIIQAGEMRTGFPDFDHHKPGSN